jgi:hypothetical protein
LAEQTKKPNRTIQEANQQRWLQYQEIQRMELTAKIAAANAAGGTTTITVSDTNAQAFITAAAITNITQANAVNSLVIGLKADGLWTPMQALYPFVGGSAATHKYNLKDPRDLNAAYRINFFGGVTHNSNGVTFNGVNGVGETNYVNFQTGELGAYNRGGNLYLGGSYTTTWQGGDYPYPFYPNIYTTLYDVNGSAQTFFSNNDDSNNVLIPVGANLNLGFTAFSGGGVIKLYKNGVLNSSFTPNYGTDALPISLTLGAVNYGAEAQQLSSIQYGNSQLAFAFITTTILNGTQNTNLYNRVQTFQTALSRQV